VIRGAGRITRFFAGLARKGRTSAPRWTKFCMINGLPGMAAIEQDGTLQTIAVEIAAGRIAAISGVRNPDKLGHLGAILPRAWAAPQVPPLHRGAGDTMLHCSK
jgi:RNA polymerase sigma-70 factor (ECF subfamily)